MDIDACINKIFTLTTHPKAISSLMKMKKVNGREGIKKIIVGNMHARK